MRELGTSFYPDKKGLYNSANEHDSCGVGFVVNIDGTRSHKIIEQGIEVLVRLLHRGAIGGDENTGDGAGILFQVPDEFFRGSVSSLDFSLPERGKYGVGMIFLPKKKKLADICVSVLENEAKLEGLDILGWRNVPVDSSQLGRLAKDTCPDIRQIFVSSQNPDITSDELERKLYLVRRGAEKQVQTNPDIGYGFYVPSMSSRTIIYKGLLTAPQLPQFYPDLLEKDMMSSLALIHQRYSTNTFPTWYLAQPFRYLGHNGEINTLRGNINQMKAREGSLDSDIFKDSINKIIPVIQEGLSDSACLDNALEFFVANGRSLPHSMMMLIPEAWGEKYNLGQDLKSFFEYHAGLMEPWDGPAAVAFTDGRCIGALLDRNGLRPARYTITKDNFMVLASEAGVLDIPSEKILRKGRLRPGQMIYVDLSQKRVLFDNEIKIHTARRQPYRRWVDENKILLHGLFDSVVPPRVEESSLTQRQTLFGYSREDLKMIMEPMAETGYEPTGSMGNDAALAVLSEKPQLLFAYFKQLFAQVTNPPIDPIREELVMSLTTFVGKSHNILKETPQHAHLVKLKNPILTNEDLERLRTSQIPSFQSVTLKMSFPADGGGKQLENALENLCVRAEKSVRDNKSLIILSDQKLADGHIPMPSLLAVSAVNHHLIRCGLRTSTSIVVSTGEAREVMHFALLLGYGATAVNPYLALETVAFLYNAGFLSHKLSLTMAIENYIRAVCKGLLKTMSKMGISTLRSYRGAQIFEAVGLDKNMIDKYFTSTVSRIGGIDLEVIAAEANTRFNLAYKNPAGVPALLPAGGQYSFRRGEEKHLWTPETITKLQQSARANDYEMYKEYAGLINNQEKNFCTLRGLFRFKKTKPVPIDEVEPASEIVKHFVTGAMSFGSISKEAHETLAIAMNRLGGMSNSGEGGEDPARFKPLPNGDSLCSAVKQIASGRFGVTIEYLVNAKELQIKIAQGAKPGEGGQLPGHKVDKVIARVRHSTPGVTLISPPPHHDIYSIEDLAQLIYDLKCANPDARISVKLVSEVGVGTIAAGVAKAHADMVLISGHDGGTGASPLSSIKHAGLPWELGIAETQQTLVLNNLRDRIRLQVDGQMKTGRDVVIGAMLGAEEFGFATTALVVCGCVMMRKCHQNTCPVGVATQDPELRKRYSGKPEYVMNFLLMLAQEIREYLAMLGFRKLDDIVGRNDLLEMNSAIDFWKVKNLDFTNIFMKSPEGLPVKRGKTQDHNLKKAYDHKLLTAAKTAIENTTKVNAEFTVSNRDRTIGAMLSSAIAKKYGNKGLPKDTINFTFRGCAGQSFGAFLAHGVTFTLIGEANDYLGKGLSGGKIIVRPDEKITYDPSENIIAGNVLLYGATSGEVYINGQVGERFAIRNSGAVAVVEGAGDHCCEYMTGGRIAVIGPTGINFAAGMSGGLAYVLDERNILDSRSNLSMVDLEQVILPEDVCELRGLLENHLKYTGSPKARKILSDWENTLPRFVKVFPMEYRKVLGKMMKEDEEIERKVEHD